MFCGFFYCESRGGMVFSVISSMAQLLKRVSPDVDVYVIGVKMSMEKALKEAVIKN